ncbi:MAG: antitermination protein NusG [Gammaproteobacteria bacterium]|nr:antitermination protein NusG [Gammaproteobacteria bacterium]
MKLLVTGLVIFGAIMALRFRKRPPANPVLVHQAPPSHQSDSALFKAVAYGTVVVLLLGSGIYFYSQWQDAYQVITVHIIDTRSGREVTYEAYKGDVDGRSFKTTDGRVVTLAEVERLELGRGPVVSKEGGD